ncbi:MliC family protein [Kaistia adipata]|uniref:MliC family protein n=1 Tax=Kaistia adipata TaxID=166954 RepID=UPI000686A378|nr:MliC family protein [Kaistia adipata]
MMLRHRCLALALAFAPMPLAVSVALAADIEPAAVEAPADATAKTFAYQCEDGTRLTASFSPPEAAQGSAEIVFADGDKVTLTQAVSADGGRYVKDDIEFWIKGTGAMLTIAEKTTNCATSD